jgi:hypothetical protein
MSCCHWLLRSSFVNLFLLVPLAGGCHTLDTGVAELFGESDAPAARAAAAADPESPHFFVEFRQEGRKPALVALPLEEPFYVQQALEKTGAVKKFRRMKIDVYRQLPQGGGHRIPVAYDRGRRRVAQGADYAVHHKDRIVVTEDTSNVLDDILESISGPFSGMMQ